MTRIKHYINKQSNHIEVLCFGHSGYSTIGSDIVCAGISSLTQTLVAYLNDSGAKVESRIKDGYLSIVADGNVKGAYDFTLCGLKLIRDAYPMNISLEKVKYPFVDKGVDYILLDQL